MLFYDFRRLNRLYGHSPKLFRANLTKYPGPDFICNDKYVLQNSDGVSLKNLQLYLELCSYRTYSDYITAKTVDIPLIYIEDIERYNPLLGKLITITKDKIILIQEK